MHDLSREPLKNHEMVTLAVYLVGGDTQEVDTEDVAVKVNELAPGRFCWRKYKDQINIEIIRAFLSDAKKKKCGELLTGTGTSGWLLTSAGRDFSISNIHRVAHAAARIDRLSPDEKRWRRQEHARVATSDAFKKFSSGNKQLVTIRDVEAVFRLNEYIVGEARHNKVQRMVNALAEDDEVGAAIQFLADLALKETT